MILSILVRDVMVRSVAYVAIPGNRDDVLKTLQDRKVSGLPVVKKGEVVGMITRTDLLRNREEDQTALLMTRDPVVISPEKSIVEASELLIQHGIRRLPVVEGKELVGILTVADIVRVAEEMNITESIEPYLEKETCGALERDAFARSRIDYGVCRRASMSCHRYRPQAGGHNLRPGPHQSQCDRGIRREDGYVC